MILRLPRWMRHLILIMADLVMLWAAPAIGLYLRFDGMVPPEYAWTDWRLTAVRAALSILVLQRLGLYRPLWRYAGSGEALRTILGASLLSCLFAAEIFFERGFRYPRSVLILYWFLVLAGIGGFRFMARVIRRHLMDERRPRPHRTIRTLIIGAGDAGAMAAQELEKHPEMGYQVIGFIDDDIQKHGLAINGIPVLGDRSIVLDLVQEYEIDEILIAMPSAPGSVIRDVVARCSTLGVQMRIVPGVFELLNGRVTVNHIREVRPEDLLNRSPVEVDMNSIAAYLKGTRVLVTGAAGSIGSELCRHLAHYGCTELIPLDADETGLYNLESELRWRFPAVALTPSLINIREEAAVERAFRRFRPDVVFHAAALKHVPITEIHPGEAIKTNVFGTLAVARAAIAGGASRFVLISTDKAVNPTSILGATKRLSEKIVLALEGQTRFMAVRFGNVLSSRGSVVPLFQEQIRRGGPITLTHPEMMRYFMTIPEAVQLVIQAGALGQGGEVFVLDMGEPIRILDLAENLIRLSGLEPGVDIGIEYIGSRPGERLKEEVLTAEEGISATRHSRIYVVQSSARPISSKEFWVRLHTLAAQVEEDDVAGMRESLHLLVPSYRESPIPPLDEIAVTSEGGEVLDVESGKGSSKHHTPS